MRQLTRYLPWWTGPALVAAGVLCWLIEAASGAELSFAGDQTEQQNLVSTTAPPHFHEQLGFVRLAVDVAISDEVITVNRWDAYAPDGQMIWSMGPGSATGTPDPRSTILIRANSPLTLTSADGQQVDAWLSWWAYEGFWGSQISQPNQLPAVTIGSAEYQTGIGPLGFVIPEAATVATAAILTIGIFAMRSRKR